MEYLITTLADIVEQVPADRIHLCCDEIATLLAYEKYMIESGVPITSEYPLRWVDDDKGELRIKVEVAGGDDAA